MQTIKELEHLPPCPVNKKGWPWTEESDPLPPKQPDGKDWPRIGIITPSFNHGEFIEETIRSVLLQNYPNLEYIIIDGGSTDNTLDIIRKYESRLTFWLSEPDRGQSNALNKGFRKSAAEYVNWINSDDLLCKNALNRLAPEIIKKGKALYLGKGIRIDEESRFIDEINPSRIGNFDELIDIRKFWRKKDSIFQQATLFPLDELKNVGYLNEKNHFTMDYELWGELLMSGIPVVKCSFPLGMFRWYKGQKTSMTKNVTKSLTSSAIRLVKKNNKISALKKLKLIILVWQYKALFFYRNLRSFIGVRRRLRSLLNG